MPTRIARLLALTISAAILAACAPLVIGAGGAIVADTIAEDQQGGDGLF